MRPGLWLRSGDGRMNAAARTSIRKAHMAPLKCRARRPCEHSSIGRRAPARVWRISAIPPTSRPKSPSISVSRPICRFSRPTSRPARRAIGPRGSNLSSSTTRWRGCRTGCRGADTARSSGRSPTACASIAARRSPRSRRLAGFARFGAPATAQHLVPGQFASPRARRRGGPARAADLADGRRRGNRRARRFGRGLWAAVRQAEYAGRQDRHFRRQPLRRSHRSARAGAAPVGALSRPGCRPALRVEATTCG